jgi:hypothetical protein
MSVRLVIDMNLSAEWVVGTPFIGQPWAIRVLTIQ